jgi:hypothetical protein
MGTLIFLICVTAIVALSALLAYTLGWLFTEVIRLPLNFKPFTCRPCLSFWFNVILGVVLAFDAAPFFPGADNPDTRFTVTYGLTGVGILAGFINYLYIKLKFRIYD